jgi:hypothetical protein
VVRGSTCRWSDPIEAATAGAAERLYNGAMRCIAIAALSLLAAACSASRPSASGSAVEVQRTELRGSEESAATGPALAYAARGPVLAEVQFRDHVLVIRAGAGGAGDQRFDVQTRGGALLASALTRDELDRQFPAIAQHFRESTAIQLDATLERGSDGPAAR